MTTLAFSSLYFLMSSGDGGKVCLGDWSLGSWRWRSSGSSWCWTVSDSEDDGASEQDLPQKLMWNLSSNCKKFLDKNISKSTSRTYSYVSLKSFKLLFFFSQNFDFLGFDQDLMFEKLVNFVILFPLMEASEKFWCRVASLEQVLNTYWKSVCSQGGGETELSAPWRGLKLQ